VPAVTAAVLVAVTAVVSEAVTVAVVLAAVTAEVVLLAVPAEAVLVAVPAEVEVPEVNEKVELEGNVAPVEGKVHAQLGQKNGQSFCLLLCSAVGTMQGVITFNV
jgi:hypothetical protein